jgi:hypothetical protein
MSKKYIRISKKYIRMSKKYIPLVLTALGIVFGTPVLFPQDVGGQEPAGAPRVFFDCQGPQCDDTYHRTEIPWVTWVRDQQDADLHVIMTSQTTGGSGREYVIDATGREAYEDYVDQALYQSLSTDTQRERLDGVSHSLGLSFARFAQFAGFRDLVRLQGAQSAAAGRPRGLVSQEQVDDPWNLWVFRVSGNGNFSGEEIRKSRRFSGNVSASRVTPTWKQSYGGFLNYNFQKTKFPGGTKFVDRRTDWNFNSTVVYSLAEFWSLGFTGRVARNTRDNQRLSLELRPALEYSLFPYQESTRRSLTAFYEVGPIYYDYLEVTQDNELSELRYQQTLSLEFSQRQTWGDASLSVSGSQYLHDFERNNLDIGGNLSFRITRGFDVNFGGNFTLVGDQLYLPFKALSDEEILTGVRQSATDKRYFFFVGLSYQFGSIFNNVVNNRFPGGGGGGFGGGGRFRGPPGGGNFRF